MVTGTREELSVEERGRVLAELEGTRGEWPVWMTYVGDCPTGVDALVRDWAQGFSRVFKADWKGVGKAAGPLRNGRMVTAAKRWADKPYWEGHIVDVLVLAFPKGKSPGTRDCMKQAQVAGLEVRVVEL